MGPPASSSARHIHREASAIPSPALAQAMTPSAEATFIGPSTVADVARPERVKLQPARPERPGPRMQSCLARSAGDFGVPPPAREAGGATARPATLASNRAPDLGSANGPNPTAPPALSGVRSGVRAGLKSSRP